MVERKPFVIRMGERGRAKLERLTARHGLASQSEAGRLALAFAFEHPAELDRFVERQLQATAAKAAAETPEV